jgi:hypothetical protein
MTNLHQVHQPSTEPPYQDPDRPNGIASPDAAAPAWFQESIEKVTKAIFDVVHFSQHEYLDRRRLPHAIKMSEVLTKPQLLPTKAVLVQTVFPIASENCFVVYYTPVLADNQDPYKPITGEPEILDYNLFAYREGVFTAAKNVPQHLTPMIQAELKRQAKALGIRNVQFLYFTIMQPQHPEAYDDPNGYNKAPNAPAAAAAVEMPSEVVMPTEVA